MLKMDFGHVVKDCSGKLRANVHLGNIPNDHDVIIVGFIDYQFQPRRILLPHQLDTEDLRVIMDDSGFNEFAIYSCKAEHSCFMKRKDMEDQLRRTFIRQGP